MNNIGTIEITTQRLLLRAIKESDYQDMYQYTVKEEVAKYVSWSPHKSIEDTKALCKMWAEEYNKTDRYNWAIVLNGKVIGNIEAGKIIDESAFLGWQLDNDYWNQGIVTEAATAIRDFLFGEVGVNGIYASYIAENIGSGRVMQKIGMKEITHREYCTALRKECKEEIDGLPVAFYRLTKEEWRMEKENQR